MLSPTPPIDRPSLRPGTGYLIAPRVPHGLATVVEGLTREVLRHRPEDIYVFAARHFEKLLKLREEYHAEEYSDREFNHEFSRDFNLWPTKETRNIGKPSNGGWSLEKEIEIFERREQMSGDVEESQEDVSTDLENRKISKQSTSRGPATAKKTSKKSKDNEITSDARATRIISQMTALHGPGKNIQTKDIKQELRRNKLSRENSKASDNGVEKGMRGDRRSRTRVPKKNKDSEEEVERATTTTTTTSSSKTSARRPLKKVRRIETESETETEREVAAKTGLENGYARSTIKNDDREAIPRTGSWERKSEARLSEHSSERKVSSRALSMDRIRAYVLRKFASTASLEVLRSPTYVEQVQEVIDRAAPIIKEKLEEIGQPRGKRSKSVDLAWKEELHRHVREERKLGDHDEEENGRGKSSNGMERKTDIARKKGEMEESFRMDETILNAEREEKKLKRRSVGSGKRSKRRESGDFGVVDQVDDNSKHYNKLEHESGATRDTLEARLTATQSILEDISKSTSELGGARKSERPTGSDPSESEISDHVNVVSLPVVRPPSSKNSRNATKNGSDSLTLPPISPEVPKSTKKKDELSLPILPTASNNGNHSTRKPQEPETVSKDAEEASTMYDITSDIEDIAVLPENEDAIVDAKQDLDNDRQDLTLDVKFLDEEKRIKDEDVDGIFGEDISAKLDEKRGSLEEFEELEELEEGRKSQEVFKDSLNVTPEVADIPLRPDSLESDEDEVKVQNNNAALARDNSFDRLKDKLIEIEMAERSIEKALVYQQQVATCEMTSQAEKSMTGEKINETREPTNEVEEAVNETQKSIDTGKIPINKDDEERKKNNDDEKRKSTDDIEDIKDVTKISNKTEDLNINERLTNKVEKMENEIKESTNETENLRNEVKISTNGIKKSSTENEGIKNKSTKVLKNGVGKTTDQTEITTQATENVIKPQDERSMNEKLSNGIEELAVKVHVRSVQSINPRSYSKHSQITEVVETDGDDTTTSKKKTENGSNGFSKSSTSGNITDKSTITSLSNENDRTKARKKRESDKLPMTTSLSLEVPYSYVLSEGSPCEIPDSVTTVIFPDRPCFSPVTVEDEDYQLESTNQKEESLTRFNTTKETSKDERQEKNQHRYGMEIFGEYIRSEAAALPVDTDFIRGVKGINSSQDIVIIHQDLDRIKEEGEEEEEKEDSERKEIEKHEEKKNDEAMVKEEEMKKVATLEDIAEHEEIEETDVRIIGSKDAEEISSSSILECESLSDTKDLIVDIGLTNEGTADAAIECRSAPENSLEESESTQDTHTTTSNDVKESTVSNQSIDTPSPDRPVVPELNLDSLQDNTVSSFKMTANGTEKEDNGSPRESDVTTSLIESLTSDERLANRVANHEEEVVAEELTERGLQSEVPEADQLYRAEHVEYEWMGKDPLSTEINLEDEAKSQEHSIGVRSLSEDAVQIDSQEKEEAEELGSEEEIARELIDLLDKDMQYQAEKLDSKKDNEESEKSNLNIDKSNQLLSASVHSVSVEQEKRDEDSLDKIDDVIKIEATSEISDNVVDINQDNKNERNEIINKDTEKIKLEEETQIEEKTQIEKLQVAPLAQFEQDELLEENNKLETVERITIQSKSDIINTDCINVQKKLEEKQMNVEKVSESQISENKIESNRKQEEDEYEKLQSQKEHEQEKIEVHEECEQKKLETYEECKPEKLDVQEEIEQEKLKIQSKNDQENMKEKLQSQKEHEQEKIEVYEKCEQKKLETYEECKPEKLDVQEEIEQEKLKIQNKNNQDKMEEEIIDVTAVPLEVIEPREDLIKNDNEHEKTEPDTRNEFITDNKVEKNAENGKEKKTEDLSEKIESVHGPITSAISEQSEDRFRLNKYWTTETKSSTVETVIEAFDSNTNTDKKMEIVADVPEIIADESLIQKKDDFYSAVVKIQACIRGFLTRRRNLRSEFISNNVPSTPKIVTSARLAVPQDTLSLREARRLRREEALRNTTLSLENAFATGRLQHTGEFHDSVPLLPFDLTNSKTNSITSNDSLAEEIDVEEADPPDTKSSTNQSDFARDSQQGTSFHKAFVDPTFPIMMHLLTDASRNCHFSVSQNSESNFNASAGGAKPMEPTVDILMLGYPRNDENQYLKFITSVEDLGSNMNSLTLDDMMKSTKNTEDAHPSTTSDEGSLREPLALSGVSQGIVIEEITSLDEPISSDSTKASTVPKTSLDTNSSMPSEERAPEDTKNDLETSPRTTNTTEDRKQEVEGEESHYKSESVGESDLRSENANKRSNEISRDSGKHKEEKDDKT